MRRLTQKTAAWFVALALATNAWGAETLASGNHPDEVPTTSDKRPGRGYAQYGTVRQVAVTLHGQNELVWVADCEEPGFAVVFPPLEPTAVRIGQGSTWVTIKDEADDLSSLGLNALQPVLIEIEAGDAFSDPGAFSDLMTAVSSTTAEAIPANLTEAVEATLSVVEPDGVVQLSSTIAERGQNAPARIRFVVEGDNVRRLLSLRKSDLRLALSCRTPGVYSELEAQVTATNVSSYFAKLNHFIQTVPADRNLVLIPLGESADSGTETNTSVERAIRFRFDSAAGVDRSVAESLADRVLGTFWRQVEAADVAGADLVVFTVKNHVLHITLDEVRALTHEQLSQFEHQTSSASDMGETDGTKSVNLFGMITAETGGGSDYSKEQRAEMVKRLNHLKQAFEGIGHTLPLLSISQLRELSSRDASSLVAMVGTVTSTVVTVTTDFRLVSIPWASATPRYDGGWRICNGELVLVTVSADGRSLTLTDASGRSDHVTPNPEDGSFTSMNGTPGRYVPTTGEIELGDPTNPLVWQSHRSASAPSCHFHCGGNGETHCYVRLMPDGGVEFQDEHGRIAAATFDPLNPRQGTAWGIPFEIPTSHMIKWPGNFWSYHSCVVLSPHWPSFVDDLSKAGL